MDPQSRRARDDRSKRVYVEPDDAAKNHEHEWVPSQCGKEMAVKELDAASRHSARDARQLGKVVKHAVRPRQPERQPGSRKGERQNRDA